ncbi:MAG: apolipoprotein N-acyltransferase [Phycisphaerales bacterium]|nr:apolipoprotein N-acyltransferase [Phycisphaerales bacterium]
MTGRRSAVGDRPLETARSAVLPGAPQPPHLGFQIHSRWAVAGLLSLSLLFTSLIPAPLDQWYLAYVCLVPWLIVIGGTALARRVYVFAWVLGFAFFLINMRWMYAPTGVGYVALSAYLACYFPLAACPIRHAVRRRRIPLAIAVPVVWVGAEFLRGLVLSGFPWFFLAHSQYRILPVIQISDLVGAYGVTFVLAAVNGAIADLIFARYRQGQSDLARSQRRRARRGAVTALALLVLTVVYGVYRLNQDTISDGPAIALLQHDHPNYTERDQSRDEPGPHEKRSMYFDLMRAALPGAPDLYLFPETAWAWMYLNKEYRDQAQSELRNPALRGVLAFSVECYDLLQSWATETGASIVIGSMSVTPTPLSLKGTQILHNSAFHFKPGGSEPNRHDKIHPVLFGETVPFRYGRLRALYFWLNALSPFGAEGYEYSLTPGDDVEVFQMRTRIGESFRFGVLICYEDVMPYVCRRFVHDAAIPGKRVDFLLNISNDGWFLHGHELQQHFAICTFRAVENRVGIARTVNTGISGFIRPDGRAHDALGVGQVGHLVARVAVDTRSSLYSRIGDVFAIACAVVWLLLYLDYILARILSARSATREVSPQ